MNIVLAGCNIDAQVLDEAASCGVERNRLTPEVVSAAYARISRDPRPVGELRKIALNEVEKARASNRKIIFGMGHHSVAEHAVFNFDIVGISRLAIEWLEAFRLCSFTEKSQRYITLDHDFLVPKEIRNSAEANALRSLVDEQTVLYQELNTHLRSRLSDLHPEMETKKSGRTLLDGWAKEDARYVTILATTGQLGLTANARNLELIIRRSSSAQSEEVKELGRTLFDAAHRAAPSLLLFTEPSPFDELTPNELVTLADRLLDKEKTTSDSGQTIAPVLAYHTESPDIMVAAALLHFASNHSFDSCRQTANKLSRDDLRAIFETALRRMEFFDAPPRTFEHVTLTFEITLSASAYAQLKRHRMTTQTMQGYSPQLGLTIPPTIVEVGLKDKFKAHAARSEELFYSLKKLNPAIAPYALTNAHRRKVLLSTNLRELYHLVRLREDSHAQWDIRNLAKQLRQAAEKIMPLGSLLLCGKDTYASRYEKVLGAPPQAEPPS